MTLCTAWIRDIGEHEELVFATDSCLSGGEGIWNHGVKLFDLSPSIMLCFAGDTDKAYPLMLNIQNQLKDNFSTSNDKRDIIDLVTDIVDLCTKLILGIINETKGNTEDVHESRSKAEFLLGGWSWKENKFIVYWLCYDKTSIKFDFIECFDKDQKFIFLGDHVKEAIEYCKEYIEERFDDSSFLDMEPLKSLYKVSKNPYLRYVSGEPQIGKIYKSQTNEYFGITSDSSKDSVFYLGHKHNFFDKPIVNYYDHETFEIYKEELPYFKPQFSREDYRGDTYVDRFYDEKGVLKESLSEKEKNILLDVIKYNLYEDFLEINKSGEEMFSFPDLDYTGTEDEDYNNDNEEGYYN